MARENHLRSIYDHQSRPRPRSVYGYSSTSRYFLASGLLSAPNKLRGMVDQSYQSPLLMQATNGKLDLHLQGHKFLHLDAYFARLRFRSSLSAPYCLIIEYNIEKQKVKAETAEKFPLYNHTFFDEGFCSRRKLLLSVLLLPLFFTSLST